MTYDWDEDKNQSNKVKHDLDFSVLEKLDWDFALYTDSQVDPVSGEIRELVIGPVENRLVAVVITERETTTRIISLRPATNVEIALWKGEYYG